MKFSGLRDEADLVLEGVVAELEVSQDKQDEARAHYKAVGEWLNGAGSPLATYRPEVYAHGSFAIGTAVRPLAKEDLDVDAACVLEAPPAVDQRTLKEMVGDRLKELPKYRQLLHPPDGGRRCWTLQYSEATRFHLDILPAIPDSFEWLKVAGVPEKYASHALKITDRTTFDQPNVWTRSNPKGYMEWFRVTMMMKRRPLIEKRADVEAIPEYQRSTTLQQVIKILKRHRDLYYSERHSKPISIVITTLAAQAYQGEESLLETLQAIVQRMRSLLFVSDRYVPVLNPVNPMEDFTDKWKSDPSLAKSFGEWLDTIERDHDSLHRVTGFDLLRENLAKSYGRLDADAALAKYAARSRNFPSAKMSRSLFVDAPHREIPPWPMAAGYEITLRCSSERDGINVREVANGDSISKKLSLTFYASVAIHCDQFYWQVVNTGSEAKRALNLRGGFELGGTTKHENSLYEGSHWVQCFGIRNGVCIAKSQEFVIKIQ